VDNGVRIAVPSVAEAKADLDAQRPRLDKLRQLTERADDTALALGSDVMGVALEAAPAEGGGDGDALQAPRRDLSARSAKQSKRAEPALAE